MSVGKHQIQEQGDQLVAQLGLKLSTIATYAVNDGKLFKRLAEGGSCTLATAEKLLTYYDAVWPADLEWPKTIARPAKTKVAA